MKNVKPHSVETKIVELRLNFDAAKMFQAVSFTERATKAHAL